MFASEQTFSRQLIHGFRIFNSFTSLRLFNIIYSSLLKLVSFATIFSSFSVHNTHLLLIPCARIAILYQTRFNFLVTGFFFFPLHFDDNWLILKETEPLRQPINRLCSLIVAFSAHSDPVLRCEDGKPQTLSLLQVLGLVCVPHTAGGRTEGDMGM